MKPETVAVIHDFSLEARGLLEKEVSEQLEGIYGFLPDGRFELPDKYPALNELPEAKRTRMRLEQLLDDERAVGIQPQEARGKLVQEAAFTWLNRFVAFKMMETRGLIRQAITKGAKSNGFLMWLTTPGNEKEYEKYNQGDLPRNALGDGPRQEAYRHFLLWQCGVLAEEVKVLFDTDTLMSILFPRPRLIAQLIEKMNVSELDDAWALGNEETIGWVYQSFNSEDLEKAFREARLSGRKFEADDIPSFTQLFTPRWIVRFLVENSLGRLWVNMHPDSRLAKELKYLVPLEVTEGSPLKPVKDIKLLDPACGTMHFGLIAFELFWQMYKEEIECAGQAGWPERPSIEKEEEVPSLIMSRNLFGIDIDLRAVQLSALTLYLKAKTLNPKAVIRESKLATANVHMMDGDRLDAFLQGIGHERPILKRVLTTLREKLHNSEQLGSLLRLEKEIETLIEKERALFEKEGLQMDIYGSHKERFEADAGSVGFWRKLGEDVTALLNAFAAEQSKTGLDQTFFAGETEKGLRLLEFLTTRYDVVVTNPPYMSNRKMNSTLKALVSENYPEGKGDLYAAFVRRCLELAGEHGRVGMLTMHSFMFISSYEKLRQWIRERVVIETLVHLGPALFSVGNPGTLQTAAFILTREPNEKRRTGSAGTFFRLVKQPDGDSKRRRFEEALAKIRAGGSDPIVYRYRQGDFDAIPGCPWVYHVSGSVRKLFLHNIPLSSVAKRPNPGNTSDNLRFLRFFWEVRSSDFGVGKKWIPYSKGGEFRKWYGNNRTAINWSPAVRYFYGEDSVARITDEEYWYRVALTYNSISAKSFSARYFPALGVYVRGGPAIVFESGEMVLPCLGILNSRFVEYVLRLLNPTVNFQGGNLDKLPLPSIEKIGESRLPGFVKECVDFSILDSAEDETTSDFVAPPVWTTGINVVLDRHEQLANIEREINEDVYRLYDISDDDRRAIESELAEERAIEGDQEDENAGEKGDFQAAPLTCEALARQWTSYAIGIVMGRFEPGVKDGLGRGGFTEEVSSKLRQLDDPDGVLVMDQGHPDDVASMALTALTIMLGDGSASEVVRAATGKEGPAEDALRDYLDRTFFKLHIQQYRKRPIYWLLQSPRKKYGVWLFHEKLTKDTLFRVKTEYVEAKIRLLESQVSDLKKRREATEGRSGQLDRDIADATDIVDDVMEFLKRLGHIINERGYEPHIDDGVLLNMAPLWELIPSWQAEPKKAWEALERGDYDWAYQAMDHWPERVKEKCKINKSYAVGHGIDEIYGTEPDKTEVKISKKAASLPKSVGTKRGKTKSAAEETLKKMGIFSD